MIHKKKKQIQTYSDQHFKIVWHEDDKMITWKTCCFDSIMFLRPCDLQGFMVGFQPCELGLEEGEFLFLCRIALKCYQKKQSTNQPSHNMSQQFSIQIWTSESLWWSSGKDFWEGLCLSFWIWLLMCQCWCDCTLEPRFCHCSPLHPTTLSAATRAAAGIPKSAAHFAWAYPASRIPFFVLQLKKQKPPRCQIHPNPWYFLCFLTSNGRARKLGSCIKHLRWTSWNIQTFGLFGDPSVLSWNMEETSTNSWDFNPSEMKLVWSICKHVLSIHCDVSIISLFTSSMTWGYVYFDQDCNVVGTTSISVLQKIQCLRCSSIVAEKESCIQTVS